jgi:signal recognition particle receptor subunit beta
LLPAALVKTTLEAEVGKVRSSRSKGLLDSGIGMGDAAEAEERDDWVGEMGSNDFKFSQMEEFNINVEVIGGSVIATDEPEVERWWSWVEQRL